jgi:hypothetical protein
MFTSNSISILLSAMARAQSLCGVSRRWPCLEGCGRAGGQGASGEDGQQPKAGDDLPAGPLSSAPAPTRSPIPGRGCSRIADGVRHRQTGEAGTISIHRAVSDTTWPGSTSREGTTSPSSMASRQPRSAAFCFTPGTGRSGMISSLAGRLHTQAPRFVRRSTSSSGVMGATAKLCQA